MREKQSEKDTEMEEGVLERGREFLGEGERVGKREKKTFFSRADLSFFMHIYIY